MKYMKPFVFLLPVLFLSGLGASGQGRILQTGEIPGYVTLHCDFHTHTVFSDGEVWPVFRIREAVADGLDAISLTGNTDIHGTTAEVMHETGSTHREMTLVFATGRTIPALREALFAGRTIVWYGDTLAGSREMLEPFLQNILVLSDTMEN